MIREIESECLRAERNEKVNLTELKEKLSKLTEKIQKSPNFASHSSGQQDKELAVLQSRVNALSKTKSSAWVNPVLLTTACAISGIAMVWMGLSLFSSSTPTTPQPPSPPSPTGFDFNDLALKTKAGDCAALAQLIIGWKDGIFTNTDSEKTYLINSYKVASQYNTLVWKASNGNKQALEDLNKCWSQVETNVPEAKQVSIEETYNAALIPDYLVLKNQAIGGDSTSMNALRSSFQQPDLSSSYREKYSIQNAFASKVRSKVDQGDTQALNVLESEWQNGFIWDSDKAKSDLRQRYYQAILQKVKTGESEAWKILTTAWYEGKTSVGIGPGYDPTDLLSDYYKNHPKEWGQAQQGDLKTMIGLSKMWKRDRNRAPSQQDQGDIVTAFNQAFSLNYQKLIQNTKSGDKNAMDAMKRIWFECEQLIRPGHVPNFCSIISITKDNIESVRDAYNLARVPDFTELQKKASLAGDDDAMSTLKTKWEDGTLDVLKTEREAIEKEYKFRKFYEQKIAEARSGDWVAMDTLKSYWKDNGTRYIIIASEDLKSSIETDYETALPKKYQEAMEAAKNDQDKYSQDKAQKKLRDYWEGNAISNKHHVDREDYYSAVIPDYKNLKEKMLEGDLFAKVKLESSNYDSFLAQKDHSSLIEGYWNAQVNKARNGDVSAKLGVDFQKDTGRFDAQTYESINIDYCKSRAKIDQANQANPPTKKKKSKK